jgi:hypothetical protein
MGCGQVLFVVILIWGVAASAKSGDSREKERFALEAIAFNTKLLRWKNHSGWLSDSDYCSWFGVTCDRAGGHVIALTLTANGLDGRLPEEIGMLSQLQSLNLNGDRPSSYSGCTTANFHNQSLPSALFLLTHLEVLWLEYGCWGGVLDPLGFAQLKRLRVAKLHGNYFHGSIPASSFNLMTNLSWFDLGRNPLVTNDTGCLFYVIKMSRFVINLFGVIFCI